MSIIGMGVSVDDRATIERILSGDIDAFGDIVAEYKGLVFHVVRGTIAENLDHEDLAQDIFIRVYESLPGFQFRCGYPVSHITHVLIVFGGPSRIRRTILKTVQDPNGQMKSNRPITQT